MMTGREQAAGAGAGSARISGQKAEAFEILEGAIAPGLVFLADHASAAIPAEFGALGLDPRQLERHIAYDIGVATMTRALARAFDAPAVLGAFSRLLIDPNRGLDDPTLVMRIADGAIVPGNARIDAAGIAARVERFYRPYDDAVAGVLAAIAARRVPIIVSLHSFTPAFRGRARPWHVGVLWDNDPRLAVPLIGALRAEPDLQVGDNEPYDGALFGDTLHRHATGKGWPNVLVELRQDLIATEAAAQVWAGRLADLLAPLLRAPDIAVTLAEARHFSSRGTA